MFRDLLVVHVRLYVDRFEKENRSVLDNSIHKSKTKLVSFENEEKCETRIQGLEK